MDAPALAQLRSFQPGVDLVLLGAQGGLWVGAQRQKKFAASTDLNAWAQQVKSYYQARSAASPEAAGTQSWLPWALVGGAVVVVGVGGLIYFLNPKPVVTPGTVEQGHVECCVGE